MISKENWEKIVFIAKDDEWFVEGTTAKLLDDFSDTMIAGDSGTISDGFGLFEGYTNETYEGYIGDLPRLDEETCAYSEFNIYYEGVIINDYTIEDVENLVKRKERENKLGIIFSL